MFSKHKKWIETLNCCLTGTPEPKAVRIKIGLYIPLSEAQSNILKVVGPRYWTRYGLDRIIRLARALSRISDDTDAAQAEIKKFQSHEIY